MLKILEDIVNEDEHRIIRFLLSNTIINTKIIGATEKKPFFSNVGTPQADTSLSPVLFTIYLEHALKEVRPVLPKPSTPLEKVLPREIAYADDVDYVAFQDTDIEEVQSSLETSRCVVSQSQRHLAHTFAHSYLRKDGAFVLDVIRKNSSSAMVDDLILELWALYTKGETTKGRLDKGGDDGLSNRPPGKMQGDILYI
ncbi:innexin [Elysia marginata]|uniref:Innexin n=1 Tax=Elysia marginata TaxID=1093978 RepID=A0AAV4JDJ3_9GAST|nr:innexin [Elysia marginata]